MVLNNPLMRLYFFLGDGIGGIRLDSHDLFLKTKRISLKAAEDN